MQTFSLAHAVDVEAQRLGLNQWEVVNIIANSIERSYLREGRYVHVTVDTTSANEPVTGVEAKEAMGGTIWIPLTDIRPPNLAALKRDIEAYVQTKEQQRHWWLAECIVLTVEVDHYLVEVSSSEQQGLVGKAAVLPASRVSRKSAAITKGETVWVVLTTKRKEKVDGAEAWHNVDCDYVASRTDSIFLRMLIKQYWRIDATADIANGAGLVVAPKQYEIGAIIGPNGRHIELLKKLSGLTRIVVARDVENRRTDLRLTSAVRQITGLAGVKVRTPAKDTDTWRLIVSNKDAKILIGANGTNLRFISSLAGVKIQHFIRD